MLSSWNRWPLFVESGERERRYKNHQESMRLRIRSVESKVTRRIEVANFSTFQHLLESVSSAISASPGFEIHLSLNSKDRILPSSPNDSLHSIGISSGDLIYYSLCATPLDFQTLADAASSSNSSIRQVQGNPSITCIDDLTLREQSNSGSLFCSDTVMKESGDLETSNSPIRETEGISNILSESCYLRKVLRDELATEFSCNNLIMVAVHAVFLEAGFIRFDSLPCCTTPDEFHAVSLSYTLPQLIMNKSNERPQLVIVKFQRLGHLINIYGCLAKTDGSMLYRICFNEGSIVTALSLFWTPPDKDTSSSSDKHDEKEVIEFWNSVKHGIALPLLIHLCGETGLVPPPCWIVLPSELKINILERLPAIDIARMGCVCVEMNSLSSNDDLWKYKYLEEFGPTAEVKLEGILKWKKRFATSWVDRKNIEKESRQQVYQNPSSFHRLMRHTNRLPNHPNIIGGDYDLTPHGVYRFLPFEPPHPSLFHNTQRRHGFVPRCDMGGGQNQ